MTHQYVRLARPGICLMLALLLAFIAFGGSEGAQQQRPSRAARRDPGSLSTSSQRPARQQQAATHAKPRLVLVIVVDQFRNDFLDRFGDLFGANGLRRLMRDGAQWTNANYDHMPTYTAPGHATIMTGAWPAETGIIANDWYDREAGRVVSNASDPEDKFDKDGKFEKSRWRLFGGGDRERASSPRRLIALSWAAKRDCRTSTKS